MIAYLIKKSLYRRRSLSFSFFLVIVFFHNLSIAQCISADFNAPDTVCIQENIFIEANGVGNESTNFEWDLCPRRLDRSPTFSVISNNNVLDNSLGLDIVQNGTQWHGFFVNSATNELYKINYGQRLTNTPSLINLGNPSNLLDQPYDIEVFNEGEKWYGIVVSRRNSSITKLSFNNDLSSILSAEYINGLSQVINPTAVEIIKTDALHVILTNGNVATGSIVYLNFENGFSNQPIETKYVVPGSQRLEGISVVQKDCNHYVGLISSNDNKQMYVVNFENGFSNPPISTKLNIEIQRAAHQQLIIEKGLYYAIVQTKLGNIFKLTFNDPESPIAQVVDLGRSERYGFGFELVKDKELYRGFSINQSSGKLVKFDFPHSCTSPTISVDSFALPRFSYDIPGTYFIDLKRTEQGLSSYTSKKIIVKGQQAPQIDFTTLKGACVSSDILFLDNSIDSLSIISYQWFFGDGYTATGKEIIHQYTTPGTYPVTLEVETADGCGQRVTKDITIYEPPEPKFEVDKEVICTNGEITFQNITDTKGADEVISYAWDFNGEGTSTETNPTFTFTSGGSKTVTLTTSIPGCSNTYDTTFVVDRGPVVDFSIPPQICQGDDITFENLTSGENIIGYNWTFGDGGTYATTSLDNPIYTYDSAGTYIATLEVNNTIGCANTLSKTITIYARPQASFTADIACAGAPTQFVDESTTGINSNIVGWNWDFGDGQGTSTVRNPQYTYDLPGVYEASLIVLTSAGCTDTLVQEIMVESAVEADFSAQTLCPSESDPYTVQFTDMSSVTDGEQVTEWLWTINEENFVIANPSYVFEAPGTYQVSLTVFSETACNASVNKNITIATPPTPDFSFTPNCAGEPVSFNNLSLSEEVEVSQYLWNFAGLGVSYDENPSFVFEDAGTYEVSLTLETATACEYTIRQEVIIPASPRASFTSDVNYGGAPLTVNFTNTSITGTSYNWNFGGEENNSEESPTYTFTEPGVYVVSLEVEGELGCTDTFSKEIKVVEPVFDLHLQKLTILSEESDPNIRLLLTIQNRGTLNMSGFDIAITLDEVLSIHETYEGTIERGTVVNYPLNFTISAQQNQNIDLRYICVHLEELTEEVNVVNNRACISLNNNFSVVSPYPNPSGDRIKIDMVLPVQEVVNLSLISMQGKILQKQTVNDTKVGLNTFTMDVSTMAAGNYILQLDYLDHTETHRLMVKP